jgi:hypothetical protein
MTLTLRVAELRASNAVAHQSIFPENLKLTKEAHHEKILDIVFNRIGFVGWCAVVASHQDQRNRASGGRAGATMASGAKD